MRDLNPPVRPLRAAFCVSGFGHVFRAAVERVASLGIEPVLLVCEERAAADLEAFCEPRGIRVVRPPARPREQFDEAVTRACTESGADLLCLTFSRILRPELVAAFEGRALNLHMGLLPGTEGHDPLRITIDSRARFGGATVHFVTNDVDRGAIVAQAIVPIDTHETVESLGTKVYPYARDLMLQAIAWFAAGRIERNGLVRDARYGTFPVAPALEIV